VQSTCRTVSYTPGETGVMRQVNCISPEEMSKNATDSFKYTQVGGKHAADETVYRPDGLRRKAQLTPSNR